MSDRFHWMVRSLVLAGMLVLANVQGANAATVAGGGAFSASAGASRFIIVGGSAPLNCTISTVSFTVVDGSYTSFPVAVGAVTPAFAACTGPLGMSYTYNCVASPPTSLVLSGNPVLGVTQGAISGIRCVKTFTLTGCQAVIEGSLPISYSNPGVANTNGRLTVLVAGQSMAVTSTQCSSVIPVGTLSFGAPSGSGTGLSNLNYNLSMPGPTIT